MGKRRMNMHERNRKTKRAAGRIFLPAALFLCLVLLLSGCGTSKEDVPDELKNEPKKTESTTLSDYYTNHTDFRKMFDKSFNKIKEDCGADSVTIEENTVVLTFVLGDYEKNDETEAICRNVVEDQLDTKAIRSTTKKMSETMDFDIGIEYQFINSDGEILYSKYIE